MILSQYVSQYNYRQSNKQISFISSFIRGLFKDIRSTTDYMASKDRMDKE